MIFPVAYATNNDALNESVPDCLLSDTNIVKERFVRPAVLIEANDILKEYVTVHPAQTHSANKRPI